MLCHFKNSNKILHVIDVNKKQILCMQLATQAERPIIHCSQISIQNFPSSFTALAKDVFLALIVLKTCYMPCIQKNQVYSSRPSYFRLKTPLISLLFWRKENAMFRHGLKPIESTEKVKEILRS